jgi:hypothetical protein
MWCGTAWRCCGAAMSHNIFVWKYGGSCDVAVLSVKKPASKFSHTDKCQKGRFVVILIVVTLIRVFGVAMGKGKTGKGTKTYELVTL